MDFDFDNVFEGKHDMMPRKTHHVDRGEKLGVEPVDDLLDRTTDIDADYEDTNEVVDSETFEITAAGKKDQHKVAAYEYATREMLSQGGCMAFAMDGLGNVMQIATDEPDASEAEGIGDWITDANQEFMDRTGNGERWIEVVNDLARRFAEFFDGSYEAFDFAADAFGRRAWEWGLTESQLMAEEFDRTGHFTLPSEMPIFEAEYQGRKVTLNKPTANTGGKSQMKVYVSDGKNKDGTTKVKKVTFGDRKSTIKKSQPGRRKNFRARHNCDNPGPKTKARYWSCKAW